MYTVDTYLYRGHEMTNMNLHETALYRVCGLS